MNATIDIKTPSGQSLEGFPVSSFPDVETLEDIVNDLKTTLSVKIISNPTLHKGDKITIEIL